MVIELSSILEPDDFGPWFSRGHANEHNFVAQYVLVIEMRGLCYAGTLRKKKEESKKEVTNKPIKIPKSVVRNRRG